MTDESAPEKALSRCRELQCAGQIRPPLPCVEPGLVGDRAPLPEHRNHVGRPTERRSSRAAAAAILRTGSWPRAAVAERAEGTGTSSRGASARRGPAPGASPHRPAAPVPARTQLRQGPPEHPCQPECPALPCGPAEPRVRRSRTARPRTPPEVPVARARGGPGGRAHRAARPGRRRTARCAVCRSRRRSSAGAGRTARATRSAWPRLCRAHRDRATLWKTPNSGISRGRPAPCPS